MAIKKLFDRIQKEMAAFNEEASDAVANGKKAAAKRARKSSLVLQKLLKEFRSDSVNEIG